MTELAFAVEKVTRIFQTSQFYELKLSAAACSIWKLATNVTPQPLATYFSPSQDLFEYLRRQLGFFWHLHTLICLPNHQCNPAWIFLGVSIYFWQQTHVCWRWLICRSAGYRQEHRYTVCVWVKSSAVWWNIHGDTVSALPFGPHYK